MYKLVDTLSPRYVRAFVEMESYNNWVIAAIAIFIVMIGAPFFAIFKNQRTPADDVQKSSLIDTQSLKPVSTKDALSPKA